MKKTLLTALAACALAGASAAPVEHLNRGTLAVKTSDGVFVSWRSLITDDPSMTFDIYRDGTKLNTAPVSKVTNFTDPAGTAGATYEVRAIVGGTVKDTGSCKAWADSYLKIHLDRPAGGTVDGHSYTYEPNDCSVGDVDGDGEYEIFVKWYPSDAKDSASSGFTGNTLIDCYKLDGTKLWRVDLGHNIRSGAHYTQFMVYDFDGDGKAEMICKTAPGAKDGLGDYILLGNDDPTADYRIYDPGERKAACRGHVLRGPEYLTCFSGETGKNISTIPFALHYDITSESNWGDTYLNRSDRNLAGVACLDGEHYSCIIGRGYYRAAFVWAVDFDGTTLKERWLHKSDTKNKGLWGEGAHSLTIGDVDGDGKDEITYGAAALDHDGTLLYRTGGAHGDALHLAKMLPDREGLQVFMPHEEKGSDFPFDTEMRDARTGEIIFMKPQSGQDIGRGIAANVSANFPGYEYWAASDASVYSNGTAIASNRPPINFRIYWDGDLLDELLDGTQISKPLPDFSKINVLENFATVSDAASCNGTKANPNLSADILGDWREEVILHDGVTNSDLIIFTTTAPTSYKVPCLMHDHNYRMAIAFQNTAYNQPPHLSYNLEATYDTHASITVSSGSASQMVMLGDAIEPVKTVVRRATGMKTSALPEGLSWEWDAATLTGTLSGTPKAEGDYTVTLTTTGATDGEEASLQVKIKVSVPAAVKRIAYYPFDTAGATTPNVANGGTATATGNPAATDGKVNGAAGFDGASYYTQEAYPDLQLAKRDFTIAFWMKSADDAAYVFHKGSHTRDAANGTTGCWVGLELKNDVLYFAIDDDATKSQAYAKNASQWFDNQWHHIALVRDTNAKLLTLYADGKAVATGADNTGAIADNDEPLILGNVGVNFNNFFTGALDDFSIYEGAMTASAVRDAYEHPESAITEISASAPASYMVVNAMSGRIITRGTDAAAVTADLAPGVYILVEQTASGTEAYKFVKH